MNFLQKLWHKIYRWFVPAAYEDIEALIRDAAIQTETIDPSKTIDATVPFSSSFGGADTRVWISDEPWNVDTFYAKSLMKQQEYHYLQGLQAISWSISIPQKTVCGTLIFVILDDWSMPDLTGKYMHVISANEYGGVYLHMSCHNVELVSTQSGISVDDIVIEQQLTYTATYLPESVGPIRSSRRVLGDPTTIIRTADDVVT